MGEELLGEQETENYCLHKPQADFVEGGYSFPMCLQGRTRISSGSCREVGFNSIKESL